MGRIRTIKPEFHTHEELSALPAETHLLAAALTNYADDEGYFNANPVLVKAGTNPLRCDKTPIAKQLEQLVEIGYIQIRRKGLKQYGFICTFEKHQRVSHASPSKLKSSFESLQSNSGETPEDFRPEQGTGNRREQGTGEAPTADADGAIGHPFITFPLTSNKTHIVTDADITAWEQAYPAVDVRQELRKALVWLDANPQKRSVNITGSKQRIVKWLGRSQNNSGGSNGRTSRIDQINSADAGALELLASMGTPAYFSGGAAETGRTPGPVLEGSHGSPVAGNG
jgi:hypothetical protein